MAGGVLGLAVAFGSGRCDLMRNVMALLLHWRVFGGGLYHR